jgi:methionine aminotransferase
VDISGVSQLKEADFCQWLTIEFGVAAIPMSALYVDNDDQGIVRFCFAKKDETLRAALDRLAKL